VPQAPCARHGRDGPTPHRVEHHVPGGVSGAIEYSIFRRKSGYALT
jgi:hypothetical protein